MSLQFFQRLPRQPPSDSTSQISTGTKDSTTWAKSVRDLNSSALLSLIVAEIKKIDFKIVRQLRENDPKLSDEFKIAQHILAQMMETLNYKFLKINHETAQARDVNNADWSMISACRRSENGTTGIYFLQCGENEIVVAKPISNDEFLRQKFVNQLAEDCFQIRCPKIRLLSRKVDNDSEFSRLETAVKLVYEPLHRDMYEGGGSNSCKKLFESPHIMLMELVQGRPVCHRTEGQRYLEEEDFTALGRLFLFDLMLRNTDRLPCSKAIPRPGATNIEDQGNAGNVMFGHTPGDLWSIDPEMQTRAGNVEEYIAAVKNVINEIVGDEDSAVVLKILEELFCQPVQSMVGILDTSLDKINFWSTVSPIKQRAINQILDTIRFRVEATIEEDASYLKAGPPPAGGYEAEREWREWMRLTLPRTAKDVVAFIEAHTGMHTPSSAAEAFKQGFKESVGMAALLSRRLKNGFLMAVKHNFVKTALHVQKQGVDVSFTLNLMNTCENYQHLIPARMGSLVDANEAAKKFARLWRVKAARAREAKLVAALAAQIIDEPEGGEVDAAGQSFTSDGGDGVTEYPGVSPYTFPHSIALTPAPAPASAGGGASAAEGEGGGMALGGPAVTADP